MNALRITVTAILLLLTWPPGFSQAKTMNSPIALTSISVASLSSSNVIDSLRGLFNNTETQPKLLAPEEAFQLTVTASDSKSLVAKLTAAKDYYLYRDRITFSIQNPSHIEITKTIMPAGKFKNDPTFGQVEVYYETTEALIETNRLFDDPNIIKLIVSYQGCNDPTGVCYPPIEESLTISLPNIDTSRTVTNQQDEQKSYIKDDEVSSKNLTKPISETSMVQNLFAQESSWVLLAAFFGFGLVLAFTPCILPMIPILSGIIVGQGNKLSRKHAFALSLVYVLAMAMTYALAGVAAGLAGTMLSVYLQNPWVLGSFAAIFVLLAFSMFGFYQLQIPASLQSRLANTANHRGGGKVLSVFLMGMLSAIIIGPCVAAPLAGALLYISQTGDVFLGGFALFSLALGMGVPLLVFGTAAGTLLPKAGAWMKSIQHFFGFTMLAVAIYLVSPVISAMIHMILWAVFLIITAMYLKALDSLPETSSGAMRFGKGLGVIALTMGLALLIGVLSGSNNILQPLSSLSISKGAINQNLENTSLKFQKVTSLAELEAQLKTANGRYVMLDFWADWCVSCKEMELFTFSDNLVQKRLKDVVLLKADVTANNATDQALLKRFNLFGPPGIVFFDKQGKEIDFQVIGFQSSKKFLDSLNSAIPF